VQPDVEVTVRESRRVRAGRIVVAPYRGVEVVVRPGTSQRSIERLLRRHEGWIADRLHEARAKEQAPDRLGLAEWDGGWLAGERVPRPRGGLTAWYRRVARDRVGRSLHRQGERLGITGWSRIRIADQRSRWGSCSTSGTLSFSWRLVVAPAEVLDYVVIHELCHLRQPNHSRSFWRLLEEADTEWRASDAWLRRHGAELRAYVPPS
jgi:hypothetical protein